MIVLNGPAGCGKSTLAQGRSGGFRDEPNCFLVDCYTLDEDKWDESFVSARHTEDTCLPS